MNWDQIKRIADRKLGYDNWGLYDTEIEGCHILTDNLIALLIYGKLPEAVEKLVITNKPPLKGVGNLLDKDWRKFAPVHLGTLQDQLGKAIWGYGLENCPDCDEQGHAKCDLCEGTGFVDCDCDCPFCTREVECFECGGVGKIECDHKSNLDYGNWVLFRSYDKKYEAFFSKLRVAQALSLVAGADWHVDISIFDKNHPILIEGNGWKLVIMPVRIFGAVVKDVPVIELLDLEKNESQILEG